LIGRPNFRIREGMMIVNLGACDIRDRHEWTWKNETVHVRLHAGLLCTGML
jgi:hypothetical protein